MVQAESIVFTVSESSDESIGSRIPWIGYINIHIMKCTGHQIDFLMNYFAIEHNIIMMGDISGLSSRRILTIFQ